MYDVPHKMRVIPECDPKVELSGSHPWQENCQLYLPIVELKNHVIYIKPFRFNKNIIQHFSQYKHTEHINNIL